MVGFGTHLEAIRENEIEGHGINTLYIVPYNEIKKSIFQKCGNFEELWKEALLAASNDLTQALEDVWNAVFEEVSATGVGDRGTPFAKALEVFVATAEPDVAAHTMARWVQIHTACETNAEALRKLVKKFDKRDASTHLSTRLLPLLYSSPIVTAQSMLRENTATLRSLLQDADTTTRKTLVRKKSDISITAVGNRTKAMDELLENSISGRHKRAVSDLSFGSITQRSKGLGQDALTDISDISHSSHGKRSSKMPSSSAEPKKDKMKETTDLVLADLEVDSPFFRNAPNKTLPAFTQAELKLGPNELGRGEFGVVFEVTAFQIGDTCTCPKCLARDNPQESSEESRDSNFETPPKSIFIAKDSRKRADTSASNLTVLEDSKPANDTDDQSKENVSDMENLSVAGEDSASETRALRAKMATHCRREGLARYAVKMLRRNISSQIKIDAAIDLACEAKYLANLTHPNVVRLRGTVGIPGTYGYWLIMDRLTDTLANRIKLWRQEQKKYKGRLGVFGRNHLAMETLYADRITALFDIARAMRYLHRQKILYRDIKPENIGVDVRGDMRIFDFGLARELKPKDLLQAPDQYEATGLTGSRRYMAPEVVRCLPYGFSADVYGYGILFWEVMSLKIAFDGYDATMMYDRVVFGGKRPPRLAHMPRWLNEMVENSWSDDPSKRPSFDAICQMLQAELSNISAVPASDQTQLLMNKSLHSLYE